LKWLFQICLFEICVTADTVRQKPVTCRAVDADVAQTIKDWLRFAKEREGGRQRRADRVRA